MELVDEQSLCPFREVLQFFIRQKGGTWELRAEHNKDTGSLMLLRPPRLHNERITYFFFIHVNTSHAGTTQLVTFFFCGHYPVTGKELSGKKHSDHIR